MPKLRERFSSAAPYVAGAVAPAIPAAYGGAEFYNSKIGDDIHATNVPLGEYVDLHVYAQHGGTDIYNGLATDLHLPHVASNIPLVGHVGAHIDIAQFNAPLNSHGFPELIGLANNFNSIEDSIKHAIIERLAVGGGIGALAAGLAGVYAVHKMRNGLLDKISERFKRSKLRTAGVLGATAVAASGCGAAVNGEFTDNMPAGPAPTPITSIYPGANNVPALKGATISGTEGMAAKSLAHAIILYVNAVNKSWQQGANNFNKAFYSNEAQIVRRFQTSPNVVGILDIADMHCNYAADHYYFPALLSALKPNIINNTGDIFTNSDTMPYENNCATDFENDVKKVEKANGVSIPIINVTGDHDPNRPIPGTITLGSNSSYSAKVDNITFVGIGSEPRVIWSDIPATEAAQKQLLANEGATLANQACQIEKQTGEAPFVDVDQPDAADQVLVDGCAQIVNVSATHHEKPFERFLSPNGNTGIWHMAGTATGANIGLTIEETQQLPATVDMEYYNTQTRQFVGFITVSLAANNNVSFINQNVPGYNSSVLYDFTKANEFLRQYPAK